MSVFHVTIQGQEYDIEAATASESIVIALDTYNTAISEEPDSCLINGDNQGICICTEYSGELQSATPAP